MTLLSFPSVLDQPYNFFSRRILCGTQSDTFNASAFAGNSAPCGHPPIPTCPGDEKPTDGGVKYNQDEEDEFWRGFKPSMELRFMDRHEFRISVPNLSGLKTISCAL
ncbi:hypothetical protein SLE2022_357850 [Rubroshorea leprosula]